MGWWVGGIRARGCFGRAWAASLFSAAPLQSLCNFITSTTQHPARRSTDSIDAYSLEKFDSLIHSWAMVNVSSTFT
jgi:hypothetical protein